MCVHSDQGCSIYAERPQVCREYVCLWREEEFGEAEDRPDLLGLMLDVPANVENHPHYEGIPVVCVREVREKARDEPRATTLLLKLARQIVIRLTDLQGKTQLMGPQHLISVLVERAKASP